MRGESGPGYFLPKGMGLPLAARHLPIYTAFQGDPFPAPAVRVFEVKGARG